MRPLLSNLNLWRRHEERVCEVLAYALILLQNTPELEQDENEINRKLHFCIREANGYFTAQGRGVNSPIVYEARNQPALRHRKAKALREDKRPDFLWGFRDLSESDPQKQDKFFCIECKRLGKAPNRTWVLNENYVTNGIARFYEEASGYAIEVDSGAMVGYVESLDFPIILKEINSTLTHFQPKMTEMSFLTGDGQITEFAKFEQIFDRPLPISPFTLNHFWIDLRGKVIPLKKKTTKGKPTPKKNR